MDHIEQIIKEVRGTMAMEGLQLRSQVQNSV